MFTVERIIRETHRGLLFRNGRFVEVASPGRYKVSKPGRLSRLLRLAVVDIVPVDIRQRELTIKGQEILTADKVAIRVSILVQFRVPDPRAAVLEVESFEDRIYSDVQLAARRALAAMTFEEILTNRNRLSEEIMQDVQGSASSYGVEIRRADVKDLVFPGNLQDVMNRVLQAERLSQAELVEARTKAEKSRIDAEAQAAILVQRAKSETEIQAHKARADAEEARIRSASRAEAQRLENEVEIQAVREREKIAGAYAKNPAMLRMEELRALRELAKVSTARLYIGFDKHWGNGERSEQDA